MHGSKSAGVRFGRLRQQFPQHALRTVSAVKLHFFKGAEPNSAWRCHRQKRSQRAKTVDRPQYCKYAGRFGVSARSDHRRLAHVPL